MCFPLNVKRFFVSGLINIGESQLCRLKLFVVPLKSRPHVCPNMCTVGNMKTIHYTEQTVRILVTHAMDIYGVVSLVLVSTCREDYATNQVCVSVMTFFFFPKKCFMAGNKRLALGRDLDLNLNPRV